MMSRGIRLLFPSGLLLAFAAHAATKAPKIPSDAPYCARPGARALFLSPMGEPFRGAAGQAYPAAAWFAGADANHDGAVDRAEFVADARRFFQTLDHDHDGRLTPEEVIAYERDIAPEIALYTAPSDFGDIPGGRDRGRSRGGGIGDALGLTSSGGRSSGYGGPMGAGRYAWLNIPEPVVSADSDIDRVITLDEFAATANRRFDTLDVAHKGALRLADLPRTPAQIAIEGPCRPRPKPRGRAKAAHENRIEQGSGPRTS